MNNCTVCDGCFRNDNPNKIICDGICRQSFHAECVNFNKNALMCYREMPNLQWFCDGCIIQSRSSNVVSPLATKFNSTVAIPTSSPSYVQRSLIAAKRNRNRHPFLNEKPKKNSVFLVNRSPTVERDVRNASDSMSGSSSVRHMQPGNHLDESSAANGSAPLTSPVITKSDVVQSKPQRNLADFEETTTEPSESKTEPDNSSSFAEVLAKSSVAEPVPANAKRSTTQLDKAIQSQLMIPSDTHKVLYVSNCKPSVTELEIVDYLLRENMISSAGDVSCKILVSPYVNRDSVSFVSFKITVNSKIFHSLLNEELWPEGITVREFVNR
ncbi:uncharacterized protein LOC119084759 [Bradysia coprophila]|uniref:uncharacterized protein LOC119084759 n=1 Tax=Bradysia coprophila TaxID=38358 RepID=UPI00187D824B|nr:uncharacterized protein LOC119084759 [Bradysia coprophila]